MEKLESTTVSSKNLSNLHFVHHCNHLPTVVHVETRRPLYDETSLDNSINVSMQCMEA